MSCKSSINPFLCEQIKINCLFACEVVKDYKNKRYGIKSCKKDLDNDYLQDLKLLLEYNVSTNLSSFDKNLYRNKLYLEEWLKELNNKECLPDYKLQSLGTCNISELLEKINLL